MIHSFLVFFNASSVESWKVALAAQVGTANEAPRSLLASDQAILHAQENFQGIQVDVSFPSFCVGNEAFPEERDARFLQSKHMVT